jgi:serine/threonine protein kinase
MIRLARYVKNSADYVRQRFLGKGTTGEVWLCTERKSGREFAVKFLNEMAPSDEKQFIRELIVPLRLSLPGAVQTLGFGLPSNTGAGAMIVTEYFPNGTLQEAIDDPEKISGFGPTDISKAIFGIAATMSEMHSQEAIHRDLKPGNVFLDSSKEIRIGDFGLSRNGINDLSKTIAIGTPAFMAPELYVESDESYGAPVDVYAFGMVVYSLFSKTVELDDDVVTRGPQHFLVRVMQGARPKRPAGVRDDIWSIIQSCWDPTPSKRPTFRDIVRQLREREAPVNGTDEQAYREYQTRIMAPARKPPAPTIARPCILAQEKGFNAGRFTPRRPYVFKRSGIGSKGV